MVHEAALKLVETKAIPIILLLAVAGMWVHQSMFGTFPACRRFLGSLVIQMVPIAVLKCKVVNSVNRVALISRNALKVLITHVSVLILRLLAAMLMHSGVSSPQDESSIDFYANLCALVGAFVILTMMYDFRWSCTDFSAHSDVGIVHILGMAFTGVQMAWLSSYDWQFVIWVAAYANFMEVLAFMPAVWMIFITQKDLLAFECFSQPKVEQQVKYFFLWMICFNIYDDCISVVLSGLTDPFVVAGHVVHFIMILDFNCLFLVQAVGVKVVKDIELIQD